MKKYSRRILLGMVATLIFLFVMTSLFGCKWTFLKGEPEFRIVKLPIGEELYDIKIPYSMPDFTKFKDTYMQFYDAVLVGLNYNVPDSELDSEGYQDHYRLICSNDVEDMPGILAVCSFIGDESRYWLYNENNEPYETTDMGLTIFLESWVAEKYQKIQEEFEEETENKAI